MTRSDIVVVWLLRAAWLTLPLTVGGTLADAISDWGTPPRVVAGVLSWGVWGCVVVALLAPRPAGLTLLRAAVPLSVVVVAVAAIAVGGREAVLSVVAIGITSVLAVATPFAVAAINGAAYGDERRYPLRVPPALFLGPLPAAIALTGAGLAAGPLLLAARQWVAGAAALVVGFPLAAAAVRSLHGLSRRWAVLVPAGFVLVDPAAIDEAVLFRRETVRSLGPLGPRARPSAGVLDLRLGAQRGAAALTLDAPSDAINVRRGRRRSEVVPAQVIWFALARRAAFLGHAGSRRIRVDR